jgi:MFS family permease
MTVFLPFITSDPGWSRSTIGFAQSLAIWLYAFFVLLSGAMVDRIGSRQTFLIGGAISLVGWVLLSTMKSPWQLYIYYGVILALAVSMTHYVPVIATSRKWFIRRAGLVAGITASAGAVGSSIFSPVMTELAAAHGWRYTSLIMGICFSVIIILLAFFIIRDTPESLGLHPDGGASVLPADSSASIEISWAVKRAIKTSQFRLLLAAYSIYNIGVVGLSAHVVVWGTDLGSPEATAGIFSTALAASWAFGCIAGGWLGDRYGWLGIHTQQGLIALAIAVGFSGGLQVPLYVPLLGDLFGSAHVGSLFGILTFGYGLIGGCGPFIWARLHEATGSYNVACLISAVCYAIASVALLFVRPIRAKQGD